MRSLRIRGTIEDLLVIQGCGFTPVKTQATVQQQSSVTCQARGDPVFMVASMLTNLAKLVA